MFLHMKQTDLGTDPTTLRGDKYLRLRRDEAESAVRFDSYSQVRLHRRAGADGVQACGRAEDVVRTLGRAAQTGEVRLVAADDGESGNASRGGMGDIDRSFHGETLRRKFLSEKTRVTEKVAGVARTGCKAEKAGTLGQ